MRTLTALLFFEARAGVQLHRYSDSPKCLRRDTALTPKDSLTVWLTEALNSSQETYPS